LNLSGTQVSDEGLLQLANLPKLESLNVSNIQIGYDLIDRIKEVKPELKVVEYEE